MERVPLTEDGVLSGIAFARRKFGIGFQIYCGKILMAAEPAYNTCGRWGLNPTYRLWVFIEQFQRPFCTAKRNQNFTTFAPGL